MLNLAEVSLVDAEHCGRVMQARGELKAGSKDVSCTMKDLGEKVCPRGFQPLFSS